ncbi:protein tolkin-like [Microplitis mediator]|uniref:protein tolkin-like n=1 Tax=Microplitis mediator TaxID=375433 RepID=UPI0025541829|nr:protein tolkin-like [Microplitis mediator]
MKFLSYDFNIHLFVLIIFIVNSYVITDKNFNTTNSNEDLFSRTRRTVVVLDKKKLWKSGIIPYEFNDIVTGQQRRLLKKVMREWEQSTCVQFVARNKEHHPYYLLFTKLQQCQCCYVERKRANTPKFIGLQNHCYKQQIVLHELGHAIGFLHEHNHPDRDKYIEINYFNVEAGLFNQYTKYSADKVDTLSLPYDYRSIMHYTYNLSSTDPKSRTIVPIPNDQNENSLVENGNSKLSNGDIAATNLMYQCSSCGKTLYEPSGTFEQPINNNNVTLNDVERCEWRIRAAEGENIKLKIISLKIYQTYNCLFDYLEIRNGNSLNSTILARYCGEVTGHTMITGNFLLVTYVKMSNQNITSTFKVEYETICHRTIEISNDTSYNLESPNYPKRYKSNKECYWNFIAPSNHRIRMKFHLFEIEMSEKCTKDYIRFFNGNSLTSPMIGIYCGKNNNLEIISSKNKLSVLFSSDSLIEAAGFSASLIAVLNEN